tara:strand:+ start:6295 stop:9129 length:2835 start_codon:yes stop_codon:yes gene_type:complete
MARVTYQASQRGSNYEPLQAPNNAQRIKEQGDAYIAQLRELRNFQSAQEAEYIRELNSKNEKERTSRREEDRLRQQQAEAYAKLKLQDVTAQRERLQAIGGQSNQNSKTNKWVDFVSNLSSTAAGLYGEYKQEQERIQYDEGITLGMLVPHSAKQLGFNHQLATSEIITANQDTLASMAEANGADEATVAAIRSASQVEMTGYKHSLAKRAGQNAVFEFQKALTAEETDFTINYNGDKLFLNQLPNQDPTTLQLAFSQFMPNYMRGQGFGDVTHEFLGEGLKIAQNDFEQFIGEKQRQKIGSERANRLQRDKDKFYINIKDPDTAGLAVIQLAQGFNVSNGHNYPETLASLAGVLSDPMTVPDNVLRQAGEVVLPGQTKSFKEQHPRRWQEITNKRAQANADNFSRQQRVIDMEATQVLNKLQETYRVDVEDDGMLELTSEEAEKQMRLYQGKPGYEKVARFYENLLTEKDEVFRAEATNKQAFEQLTELAQSGQGLVTQEEILSNQILTQEQKRNLLKTIGDPSIPTKALTDDAKKRIQTTLVGLTKETPGAAGYLKTETMYATDEALAAWKLDYKTAVLDGKSPEQAAQIAIASFNSRVQQESGKYQVYQAADVNKVLKGKVVTNEDVGEFVNIDPPTQSPTAIEDSNNALITKYIDTHGKDVINQPNMLPKGVLKTAVDRINKNQMIIIPPQIIRIADELGGSTSVLDVFKAQVDANDLKVDLSFLKPAEEAQQSISPLWQQAINYKPQTETTDAALIGSGQEPIYSPLTALGERVKQIVGSRESPANGYDAVNRGKGGDTPGGIKSLTGKSFHQMTVGEVKRLGEIPISEGGIGAAGFYQFMPKTLVEAAAAAGITDDMYFNEAVQDRLFFVHLDEYGLYAPWERWWIEQGGPDLATTAEEKEVIRRFQEQYNPDDPWRSARYMNPSVVRHQIKQDGTTE